MNTLKTLAAIENEQIE